MLNPVTIMLASHRNSTAPGQYDTHRVFFSFSQEDTIRQQTILEIGIRLYPPDSPVGDQAGSYIGHAHNILMV